MSTSIYDATIPTLLHGLDNLAGVIAKGSEHAELEKIDGTAFLSARLFPDMFPLGRQIQIASDMAKGGAARLAGLEPPKFADVETTFAEFKARIAQTTAFLSSLEPRQFEGAGERVVVIKQTHRTLTFQSGWNYLLSYVLPNFYFHSATSYDILRHGGVKLGKGDFLGAVGAA
jgi:uncharacterized protein